MIHFGTARDPLKVIALHTKAVQQYLHSVAKRLGNVCAASQVLRSCRGRGNARHVHGVRLQQLPFAAVTHTKLSRIPAGHQEVMVHAVAALWWAYNHGDGTTVALSLAH